MELQAGIEDYRRNRTALFAVSYDSVEVLAEFAEKHRITYPLLSDEGSTTMRALGLYNEHLVEQAAFYGRAPQPHQFGVPYPGLFLLDEQGVIRAKEFEQGYRVRPTASGLRETVFDETPQAAVSAHAGGQDVRITAWMATGVYRPYQRLRLHVDLELAPGLHVYGSPVPSGMSPLTIRVEPFEGLEVGEVALPSPRPLRVEGMEEELPVHDGTFSAVVPLAIVPAESEVRLAIEVGYQACSEYACFPPARARLELPLRGVELVRD